MRHDIAHRPTVRLAALLLAALLTGIAGPALAQDCHGSANAEADAAPQRDPQAGHEGHDASDDPHAAHRALLEAGPATGDDRTSDVSDLAIPDLPVVTQDGEKVHFYRDLVEGKTVAMNFVFTTCTTICPPMGANFGRLQKELGDRLGQDVHLISVSVDPTTDTPERLKAWGEKFGAQEGWTLVTGEQQEVERLLKALQVFNADIRDHAPVALIGNDAAGRWTRAYGLAGPAELVAIVDRVQSGGEAEAPGGEHSHHPHDPAAAGHGEGE